MLHNLDFTFLGKNSKLNGNLIFTSNTNISGNVEGLIEIQNEAKLTIEIGSVVSGTIKAHHVDIYGEFSGEIQSTGTVVVFPTGLLDGIVIAQAIEVFPGANINITGHTSSAK